MRADKEAAADRPNGRSLSRAGSTSSDNTAPARSPSPQKKDVNPYANGHATFTPGQWTQEMHHNHSNMQNLQQRQSTMSPEHMAMLQQAAASNHPAGNMNVNMSFDTDVGAHMNQQLPMAFHHGGQQAQQQQQQQGANMLSRNSISPDQYPHQNGVPYMGVSGVPMDMGDDEEEEPSFVSNISQEGAAGASKGKTGRASANNEADMRQLFQTNQHRTLESVAQELHGNERGPSSERQRQLFAMLWINSNCSVGRSSVPRGKVYANYAYHCSDNKISVLNPASFGKLVRVLFHGLRTRRLGIRGESKYHYVNFVLLHDKVGELEDNTPQLPAPMTIQPGKRKSQSPAKRARLSQQRDSEQTRSTQLPSPLTGSGSDKRSASPQQAQIGSKWTYHDQNLESLEDLDSSGTRTQMQYDFQPDLDDSFEVTAPIILPPLEPFLPEHADRQAAGTLAAVYRSHCTSLAECVRFVRLNAFFHVYRSFQGTLTTPVQRILRYPEVARWIAECDTLTYQRIMMFISKLKLQVVPVTVMDMLRVISDKIVETVRLCHRSHPEHVAAAREAPAAVFAALVDRMLRVNLTAHATANVFATSTNRDGMYLDLVQCVKPRKVSEHVPGRAMQTVVEILVRDLKGLLDPVAVPPEVEENTVFGMAQERLQAEKEEARRRGESEEPAFDVLESWGSFLDNLPSRFPYATAGELMIGMERVGTAITRDITIGQGKSFSTWWVLKTWVDEMMAFNAEFGGFLTQKAVMPTNARQTNLQTSLAQEDGDRDAMDTTEEPTDDRSGARDLQAQGARAPFPGRGASGTADEDAAEDEPDKEADGDDMHDDSGIVVRTPDENIAEQAFKKGGYLENGGPGPMLASELIASEL